MSIILHQAKPSHQILSSVMNFSNLGQRLLWNCRGYIDYKETVKGYFPIDKPPHVILQLHSFHKLNGNPLDLINSHPGICCVVILTPTPTWQLEQSRLAPPRGNESPWRLQRIHRRGSALQMHLGQPCVGFGSIGILYIYKLKLVQ